MLFIYHNAFILFHKVPIVDFYAFLSDHFEEKSILLKMTSPIIVKARFSNEITGLPFTSLFSNYRKSTEKNLKLNNAIDQLVTHSILIKGIQRERHILTARKETYLKASPATIRSNERMLTYLHSINIDINIYERIYLSSPLPIDMELTPFAVNYLLSNNDFLEYCHLFNNVHIQQQMDERLLKHEVQYRMSFGRRQYYIPSPSHIIGEGKRQNNLKFKQLYVKLTGSIYIQNSQSQSASEESSVNHDGNGDPET